MGRKVEKGISYYRMNCNHIRNPKVRLLINDNGPQAYWVWQCLLAVSYETKGYYFDYSDKDSLELFASDVCKISISELETVIDGCVKRNLFEKDLKDKYGVLTSDMMQEVYLDATAERRRKGTDIEFAEELLLIEIPEEYRHIAIVPWKKSIVPRNNEIIPRNNTQSKVEDSIVEKSKVKNLRANALVGSGEPTEESKRQIKNRYQVLVKNLDGKERPEIWNTIRKFILDEKPVFIEPYVDAWNFFASSYQLSKVEDISDSRQKKFGTRLQERSFEFFRILEKIKISAHLRGDNQRGWKVNFDWILENDKNYLKIIEGQYI